MARWLYLHIHTERFKIIQCSCRRTWEANCSNLISFNHIGETRQTHVPTTYWTHKQAFVAVRLWKRTIVEERHNEASWDRASWCALSVSSYHNSLIFTRPFPGTRLPGTRLKKYQLSLMLTYLKKITTNGYGCLMYILTRSLVAYTLSHALWQGHPQKKWGSKQLN